MSNLPVLADPVTGNLTIPDENGEHWVAIHEASPRARMLAVERLAELTNEAYAAKRALAAAMFEEFGTGTVHAGGFDFEINEVTSWPKGATDDALQTLLVRGKITRADYDRAMPLKPTPSKPQIEALLRRLLLRDPEAYRILADACLTAAPALAKVRACAVDGSTA